MKLRDSKCDHCGRRTHFLELHHRTYERLGRELITDLELLCEQCHRSKHIA
jgi:5-methylcytosine-specific restriction endonuclease McrA